MNKVCLAMLLSACGASVAPSTLPEGEWGPRTLIRATRGFPAVRHASRVS